MADRKLKIQPKHRPLATSYRDRIVPELRLCGVWLEQSGFRVGEHVQVCRFCSMLTHHSVLC
jgi:hypothetical protein